MADTQADLTKALRFAIQLAEAEGYPECAAGLRVALDRLTQPTDTQADLTERRITKSELIEAVNYLNEHCGEGNWPSFYALPELLAGFAERRLQSEREAAAAEIAEWREALHIKIDTTELQREAAAAEARKAALEEAARLVDHHPFADDAEAGCVDAQGCCEIMAAQIRTLASPPAPQEETRKRPGAARTARCLAQGRPVMPSKMVPAQQLSDAGEDLVRLAAAKDAEIARLTAHGGEAYEEGWRAASTRSEELLNKIAAKDAEIALLRNTIGWEASVAYRAEITALTADKERLGEDYRGCIEERAAARAQVATLTEQRDRAMKVVEAARALGEAMNNCQPCDKEFAALWAALDAEAARASTGTWRACAYSMSKVVERAHDWADARRAAITECTPSTVDRLAKAEGDLAATVRALDAEAAAETAPSLPATP